MNHKILRCPNCIVKKKQGFLKIYKKKLICGNCSDYFPIYNGVPIMLTNKNDFYHLRKALLPARYRIII